jgi:hydrogenase-1 operon protein HyaF
MSKLSDIPVYVQGVGSRPGDPGGLGGGVSALLHEIAVLLDRLHDSGEPGAIDLRSMPMVPGDRQRLQEALGDGEVEAVIRSGGVTRIRETGIAGVWWIEYHGADDEMVAEMIEVAQVPELLPSQKEDLQTGIQRLRQRLAATSEAAESDKQGVAYGNN